MPADNFTFEVLVAKAKNAASASHRSLLGGDFRNGWGRDCLLPLWLPRLCTCTHMCAKPPLTMDTIGEVGKTQHKGKATRTL